MRTRNYVIEGISGAGKTSVCDALLQRGYHAVHGDRELAYQGDPETGRPTEGRTHEHHIWDLATLRTLVADQDQAVTFFCGGSRNFPQFIDLFDGVFVLEIDRETLRRRLDERALADPREWGGRPAEQELVTRLHETKEGIPDGCAIDATMPLERVVDEILSRVHSDPGHGSVAFTAPSEW